MKSWIQKFSVAIHGIGFALKDQGSFWIHLPCAAVVVSVAIWLRVEAWQWAAILTAIGFVLVAELLNSAIELLVKALHPEQDPLIGRALDVAAGGVLVAAVIAVGIGIAALGPNLYQVLVQMSG